MAHVGPGEDGVVSRGRVELALLVGSRGKCEIVVAGRDHRRKVNVTPGTKQVD